MKRHLIILVFVIALGLVGASNAMAAPVLEVTEAAHSPASINRGDEIVGYLVKVKNSGDTPTTGTTTVSIVLPAGVELAFGSGSGWKCDINQTKLCTSSAVVGPGAEFPQLRLEAWIFPALAPGTISATIKAVGGGSAEEDIFVESFVQGPEDVFDVVGFSAAAEDEDGADYTQAGGHPFSATTSFQIPTYLPALKEASESNVVPVESLRDAYFELPAGFVANPESIPGICALTQVTASNCPAAAAAGGVKIVLAGQGSYEVVLYRVFPEAGYPAAFAFRPLPISPLAVVLRAKLRSNGDYGVTAVSPLPPQAPPVSGVEFATLCGFGTIVPAANEFGGCKAPGPGSSEVPLLTNPTRCAGDPPVTRAYLDSFQTPAAQNLEGFPLLTDMAWKSAEAVSPATENCAPLTEAWTGKGEHPSAPSLRFEPDTTRAAAPAAYSAHLEIPQDGLVEQGLLATAHLKDTTVILPRGISLNPSAAAGLGACSEAQVGFIGSGFPTPNPLHFSAVAEGCPENSKIGSVEVKTPILGKPLHGSVYLAAQDANPLGSRFAIYLVIDDPETGTHAALVGQVDPSDSEEGRITTTFENNPQLPLEDVEISFFGGPRAALSNPDVCGTYVTRSELTSWSAADPENPLPSEIAVSEDAVSIDVAPEEEAVCAISKAARPLRLGFSAGVGNALAGASTPFSLRITRSDGSQEVDQVTVTTPPGFAAVLKGVDLCSEAALAVASKLGRTGATELVNSSCPASSRVGSTTIGAGAGPRPFYVKTGSVYLTGPYKSAPIGLAFVVPAIAGPFDLGVQVVRTALYVNPKTAQVTAKSDPIPRILDGVPLQIRDIRVDLDRPGFGLNPTNCEAMTIDGQATGAHGAVADLQNRFQVGNCEALAFKPKLDLRLKGRTKRGAYQQLTATIQARPGEANIARAAVTMPHSAFLAQEHIVTVCTRVQFAANACPKGSIYGNATAITPILDEPLTGPVYLRSNPEQELPDLVAALRGPDTMPIQVELSGRVDSKNEGIRNTFDIVPDAPVSKFTLRLKGGKKSLIVNSRDLCRKGKQRATVRLSAQNGKTKNFRPIVANDCGKRQRGGARANQK